MFPELGPKSASAKVWLPDRLHLHSHSKRSWLFAGERDGSKAEGQMTQQLRYEKGTASLQNVRAVTQAEWRALLSNADVIQKLESAGVRLADLPDRDVFAVQAGSSGFDVTSADVIIAVGGWATGVLGDAAKEILLDIWKEHVRPRLRERLGDDAVGREKD